MIQLESGRRGIAGSIRNVPTIDESPVFVAEEGNLVDTVEELCHHIRHHKVPIGQLCFRFNGRKMTAKQICRLLDQFAQLAAAAILKRRRE